MLWQVEPPYGGGSDVRRRFHVGACAVQQVEAPFGSGGIDRCAVWVLHEHLPHSLGKIAVRMGKSPYCRLPQAARGGGFRRQTLEKFVVSALLELAVRLHKGDGQIHIRNRPSAAAQLIG
jgi:hypothetical protein